MDIRTIGTIWWRLWI